MAEAHTRASATDWIAVTAGGLGALMATLDISITNSALPQIQGEIGATGTEGTWIFTGYLMSEIVMIPLAAWLTRVFGLRNFLLGNAVLFTLFSVMCGLSNSLPMMVAGRIGQDFTGGAMIPTAQTIIRTRLPREQMPVGMTIFGLIGLLLGPVLGGWLAENISWSWCFFVNLPVGIALVALLIAGLPSEESHWESFLKADWIGIAGLAIGLSSLTVVLEEGQRNQWFDRHADVRRDLWHAADCDIAVHREEADRTALAATQSALRERDSHRVRGGRGAVLRVVPAAAVLEHRRRV